MQKIKNPPNATKSPTPSFLTGIKRSVLLSVVHCANVLALQAQVIDSTALPLRDTIPEKKCEIKDMTDYARQWLNMKPKEKAGNASFFIAPVFGSTPSTGFLFGATVQGAFQLPQSKISAFQANIQYTVKNQFSISLKNNVYAKLDAIFLSGDWTYQDYSQPTYGLGTNAPYGKLDDYFHFNDVGVPNDSLIQPMNYKYYKLHQTLSFRAFRNFYLGPGIHFDRYDKIEDLKLDTANKKLTSHYTYNTLHGFNTVRYTLSGISLNLVYDSRDNMINAYQGIYANLNYRVNPTFLGSDKNSSTLWAEFRAYHGVSKLVPQKVLAVWLAGNFTMNGTLPYLTLPALGNDQRAKMGRGYTVGRFRGNNMVYGEVEYRFPISKCTKTIGGVVFANAVTTSNEDRNVGLFDYVKPGFGAGIRILFQKKSRMNIQVDYAKGNQSSGVYFGASEVF